MNAEPASTSDATILDTLLNRHFPGKVVRKDLTKQVKEGANVPVYVLEYLLGSYCALDDDEFIASGLQTVKRILAENYVRPNEAEKIKSKIRESGSYKIIDKVSVRLDERSDTYEAMLLNLGVRGINLAPSYIAANEKLLGGGIWSIITLQYMFEEGQKHSPFIVVDLKPIQMPNMDMDALMEGRRGFDEGQWLDALIRSTGMEPSNLNERTMWHLLARMIPFVEPNYNVCELGPRGTGKSHIYKEVSPNSILVSGWLDMSIPRVSIFASRIIHSLPNRCETEVRNGRRLDIVSCVFSKHPFCPRFLHRLYH